MPLSEENPFPFDHRIRFQAEGHIYFVDGVPVDKSVSTVVAGDRKPFDAPCVARQCYYGWRSKGDKSEYWHIIKREVDGEITPEKAQQEICDLWATAGPLGTELHSILEEHIEETMSFRRPLLKPHPILFPEIVMFNRFLMTLSPTLVPVRTELRVIAHGVPGTIDLLARDIETGEYIIFDYKRVKPTKKLTRGKLHKEYSLQLSCYAVAFESLVPGAVVGKMFLVRLHANAPDYELVRCTDLRDVANRLLADFAICPPGGGIQCDGVDRVDSGGSAPMVCTDHFCARDDDAGSASSRLEKSGD